MKKYPLILIKSAVGLTIFFGVFLILLANERSFRKIVADDIENISKLSASTIYAEIDNSLTQPLYVGQTIANDWFLKNWLLQEVPEGKDQEQTQMIQRYLFDYCERYGYDSVAVTSAKSHVYYYQKGINKVVSKTDAHDIWYYDFINSEASYKLNIDTDEVNSDILTVFVNSKITDKNGELLGVVGVGIELSHLQKLLQKYEEEYDLKALLIDEKGLVQVDSVDENIETANFFENPEVSDLEEEILANKTDMKIFWYPDEKSNHCLITRYVKNLDWYIVIEKNTTHTSQLLKAQINRDLFLIAILIAVVLLLISYIIAKHSRILLRTASADDVTNLPNAKMFQEIYKRNTKRAACREGIVFMFDIDGFKDVNDKFGHMVGNTVLYRISEIVKEVLGSKGVVARWGGDEFAGVVYAAREEAEDILQRIVDTIEAMREGEVENITISLGAAAIEETEDLDSILQRAETAMYCAKENGKNRVSF